MYLVLIPDGPGFLEIFWSVSVPEFSKSWSDPRFLNFDQSVLVRESLIYLLMLFFMIFGYLNSDSPFPRYKMHGRVQYMTISSQVEVAKKLNFESWVPKLVKNVNFLSNRIKDSGQRVKKFSKSRKFDSIKRKRKRKQT